MKKNKKFLPLFVSSLISISPIVSVVSCGMDKYSTIDDNIIKILVSWNKTYDSYKFLEKIKNEYNKLNKSKIEIVYLEGNYKAQSDFLSNTYQSRNKRKLVNLAIGYPATLSTAVYYDMMLDLDVKEMLKKEFISIYETINNNVENTEKEKSYIAPLGLSSSSLIIDKVVLGKILKTVKLKGGIASGSQINKIIDFYDNNDDKNFVDKEWKVSNINKKINVNDEIFTNMKKMLEFGSEVIKLFEIDNKIKNFGSLESPINNILASSASILNDSKDEFLFHKNQNGYMTYPVSDKNSVQWSALSDVYKTIKNSLESGSLYLRVGNKYSFNSFKKHNLAFVSTTTASIPYWFDENENPETLNKNESIIMTDNNKFGQKSSYVIQGPSLLGLHTNDSEDKKTIEFVKWLYETKNRNNNKSWAQLLSEAAGYLFPSKKEIQNISNEINDSNDVVKFSLKEIENGSIAAIYPSGPRVNDFRNSLSTAISSQYTNWLNKGSVDSIDEIYTLIDHLMNGKWKND
ncbi:MAG: P80 family lipoprotein [Mollicutes bacterium PWAP]|nr:P80 family lipoprotein [Mollicutes bacterium PWAP]